ncbi:hypothetical protein U1Q18_000993, partial [Sarracenia purpurea var. burkii]
MPFEAEIIGQIPLCPKQSDDTMVWHYTKNGEFSVKSAYHLEMDIRRRNTQQGTSKGNGKTTDFWKKMPWPVRLSLSFSVVGCPDVDASGLSEGCNANAALGLCFLSLLISLVLLVSTAHLDFGWLCCRVIWSPHYGSSNIRDIALIAREEAAGFDGILTMVLMQENHSSYQSLPQFNRAIAADPTPHLQQPEGYGPQVAEESKSSYDPIQQEWYLERNKQRPLLSPDSNPSTTAKKAGAPNTSNKTQPHVAKKMGEASETSNNQARAE